MTTTEILLTLAGMSITLIIYLWDRNSRDKEKEKIRQDKMQQFQIETNMRFISIEKEIADIKNRASEDRLVYQKELDVIVEHFRQYDERNTAQHEIIAKTLKDMPVEIINLINAAKLV